MHGELESLPGTLENTLFFSVVTATLEQQLFSCNIQATTAKVADHFYGHIDAFRLILALLHIFFLILSGLRILKWGETSL